MKLYANVLRAGIFFIGLYTFFAIDAMMGVVIAASGVFSFLLGFRGPFLLAPSKKADAWELCGAALILVNSFIVAFVDYNSPTNSWVDIPMHFWGGVFAAWWGSLAFSREALDDIRRFLVILGAAALVGVVWEFFEWTGENTAGAWLNLPIAQVSLNDTMGDLLFDVLGGIIIGILITKKRLSR